MSKYILYIIVLCFPLLLSSQELQDTLNAVVMDAETGEPIPYANVYVSSSCGTICNYDGEFSLQCLPSDVLRISSIGYQRFVCKASELPSAIMMTPITSTLRELTVVGADDVLYRLVRKMQKEAGKHKKAAANYFFRLTTQYPGTDELAEAFLSAKSCVQLRDVTFHSGNRGILKESGVLNSPDLKGLGRTNIHVFLHLAPVLAYYNEWEFAIVPADIVLSRRGKLYDVSCTAFKEEDGREIRMIHVTGKPASASYAILEGTLFVDYKKCQLLRFDGEMQGLGLRAYDDARRRVSTDSVRCELHVDYRHDHGFTEIASMSGTIVRDKLMLRHLLFNLGDKEMTFTKSLRVAGNMMQTIDEVGYDSIQWTSTDIVKRTRMEERIAFGDSTFFKHNKSRYEVEPSPQEAGANAYLTDALSRLKGNIMQLHRGLPHKDEKYRK